jgi:CO/xanthine dehydrogenase Mo-binding subunit/aerobic-type carbon monoxide dehydrogenase small subunit (CoxS/CutS family)
MASEKIRVSLEVNGEQRSAEVSPQARLLDLLRDRLGLTGAKEGCGRGECGACTVLLDDEPVNACMVPAFQAEGRSVVTVEGLGRPGALGVVQEAFVRQGAVQCGYCTPGMVVAVEAMRREGMAPDEHAVRERLSGNTCRCTGYTPIVDAAVEVLSMADEPQGILPASPPYRVGQSAWRVDAEDKACGCTRYTADLPLPPGCLHGVTVRAHEVHARLLAVRADEALAVPGVVRVLTAADVPGELHYGNAFDDQPVFAKDVVRFWGEAVAVVLAESLEAARAGAALVCVETSPLEAVTTPQRALEPDAPRLHPDGNLPVDQRLLRGDPEQGLAGADVVIERRYTTGAQEHLYLEPEAALAVPDDEGGFTLRAPSQNVFFDRHHICRTTGLHRKQVRVIQQHTGAAFGGREDIYGQIHAVLGAMHTGRPVRIVWSREETQVCSTKRHPGTVTIRGGVNRDGTIVALDIDVLFDTGAYASWAPNISRKALVHAAGPYDIPNVAVRVRAAYTNNGISGAFRGFGAPQVAFAGESFVTELAEAIGMDPVELRRRNHLRVGATTATQQTITGSCGLQACLDQALEAAARLDAQREPPAPHIARGRGVSTIHYGIGYGNAIRDIGSAILELLPSGGFQVRCGAIDYGQGAVTVFTQIAAQVLGVSGARIEVLTGHSEETPDSGSTVASRQTYVSGEAVRQAADRLRSGLLGFAAERFDRPEAGLRLSDRGVVDAVGTVLCSLEELFVQGTEAGVRTRNQARFKASTTKLDLETGAGDAYWPYAFAVHVADVEVDRRTGQVQLISLVAAHDVGKAINPRQVEGQITGGATQGLGFALLEEHVWKDGVPLTRNMDTYRAPGPCDVPLIVPVIVEDPEPSGPFGAKGVGEPVLVAVAPAVADAVADAIGRRVRDLPIRPERVLAALQAEPEELSP